jgi:hypothetical protein
MPNAISFLYDGFKINFSFSNVNAKLPILTHSKNITLITWGRRKKEKGTLPTGGWARLSSIHAGKWNHYNPKPVKLNITAFMETNHSNKPIWFTITPGQWIQGLFAQFNKETRVYIVTITPELENSNFIRWPRIMFGD